MSVSRMPVMIAFVLLLVACGGSETTSENSGPPAIPAETVTVAPEPPRQTGNTTGLPKSPEGIPVVRRYTQMFYAGELDALFEHFSPELRIRMPLDKLELFRQSVIGRYGTEVELIGEDSAVRDDYRGFIRWAHFDNHESPMSVEWILHRDDDTIAGFFVRPADASKKPLSP